MECHSEVSTVPKKRNIEMLQQKLQQKLSQKLSPLQIQTIKMLEIPTIELEERIKQEIEANPALEEGEDEPSDGTMDNTEKLQAEEDYNTEENLDYSLDDYRTEDDIPDYKLYQTNGASVVPEENTVEAGSTLHDYLENQLRLQATTEAEFQLAEYVIGNIDENGYLSRNLESMVDDYSFQSGTMISDEDMKRAVEIVQNFEPVGIASFSVQDCLLKQLSKKRESKATDDAISILTLAFDDFSQKKYKAIENKTELSQKEIKDAIDEIVKLNPKPGSSWEDELSTNSVQLTPDFILENDNGNLSLTLNNRNIPPLRVNREFVEIMDEYNNGKEKSKEKRDAALFVKQKLDAAKWFIDAVQQRQNTLTKTMQAIIEKQRAFFEDGDERKLKPMILKDIADVTGYDVSTISRVSNSKYIQTEFGIFPLKFFFTDGITNNEGEEVSTNEIKSILQDLIQSEDKSNPLTDDKLSELLDGKGYKIARRTVAKYREQIGFPIARMRKEI